MDLLENSAVTDL